MSAHRNVANRMKSEVVDSAPRATTGGEARRNARRLLATGAVAVAIWMLAGGVAPAAQPGGSATQARASDRFHRDPDKIPDARLLPYKSSQHPRPDDAVFRAFENWCENFRSGKPAGDGMTLARARREALAQLIELDPQAASKLTLRGKARQGLPPGMQAELEEEVRGVGSLAVVCVLSADPKERIPLQREVIVNGRHYRAFTWGHRLEQQCTLETPVHGVAIGDVLLLDETPYRLLDADETRDARKRERGPVKDAGTGEVIPADVPAVAVDEGDRISFFGSEANQGAYVAEEWTPYIAEFGGNNGGTGTTNSWTQGTRRFVAYRARLAEDATNYQPYAHASGVTAFNTVSNWFYTWSYGTCTMSFTVVNAVYSFTNSGAWYEANGGWPKLLADSRAASLGTPDAYTNFDFDSVSHNWNVGTSGYAGVAYVGGRGASFHEGYGANDGVVGHEHGHNLGLPHNNFWDTAGQSIFGGGTHEEYGNPYDIMGDGYGDWPFAANSRNRLWWLPDPKAAYNVTSGTFRIFALDQPALQNDPAHPPYFVLAMPRDGRNYVFEFRQDTNKIGSNKNLLNGVLLEVDGGFGGGPELLDCTPGTSGGKSDAPLTIGRMFTDPNVNLHVTPIARGPTSRTNWIDLVVNRNTQLSNHPPSAAISASSYSIAITNPIMLTATAADPDGDTLAYYWDFGDSTMSYDNAAVQSKSWSAAGIYQVRCTVADMHGCETVVKANITVGSPGTKYSISGRVTSPSGNPVQGIRIASGGPTVFSDADGRYSIPNLAAGSYTVDANGADAYGNNYIFLNQFPNPVPVGPDAIQQDIVATTSTNNPGPGTGFLYERWTNTTGSAVANLTSNPRYPNQPDVQRILVGTFEGPNGVTDNYGTRMRGLFIAPQTGAYRFYIASDDASELWFSTNSTPVGASKIAYVSTYTGYRTWTTYTNQRSAAINLTAGQRCYIEALHKEGGGGDHVSVGVDLPDGTQERPMPTHRLDPFNPNTNAPVTTVSVAATDATASEPGADTGTFTLTRTGDVSNPLTITFQLTGTAAYDADYLPTGVDATFSAGQSQTTVSITPRDDAVAEPVESVVLTVIPSAAHAVSGGDATIQIHDNEATVVNIVATDGQATESGLTGRFAFVRSGDASSVISVSYLVSGSASNGVDYTALSGPVTIPSGESYAYVIVSPVADGLMEVDETVVVRLQAGAGYVLGSSTSATVTIQGDPGPGTGILRAWWTGISGTLVSNLTSSTNYPNNPGGSAVSTNFEGPVNWADNYGTRFRGHFIAPVSGPHYFYIASDDHSELWLSTNMNPLAATKIAYVSGYTGSREWTKFASQKSAAVPLAAGQQYYIEALHKEGTGGDHIAVGIEYPGGTFERPIPGHRLNPYVNNTPPSAVADSASMPEDTVAMIAVLANDSDVDDDTLAIQSVTQGAHGSAAIAGTNVTYTPALNWNGTDTFSYVVSDGTGGAATGLVSVTVAPVNDAPVAAGNVATTAEDTQASIAVLANDSDVDGDTISIQSVAQGAHGSAAIAGTNVTYTPALNWNGTDTFSYVVSDGNGGAATGAVTVTVAPVNDAPTFTSNPIFEATGVVGVAYAATLSNNATDPDTGDVLTFSKVNGPSWLTVAVNGSLGGTPAVTNVGLNSFTVHVQDTAGAGTNAVLQIRVLYESGLLAWYRMDEGAGTVALDAAGLDNDGTVTGIAWTNGRAGPGMAFNGPDYVALPASAFGGAGGAITVALWVNGDAALQPQQNSVLYATDAASNRVLNIHLPWSDGTVYWDAGNSGSASYDRISKPAVPAQYEGGWNHWAFTKDTASGVMSIYVNGVLWHTGSGFTRTLSGITAAKIGAFVDGTKNYDGVMDDVRIYGRALASNEVAALCLLGNSAPVAADDSPGTAEDAATSIPVLVNDTDANGDALSIRSFGQGAHGSVTQNGTNLVYSPALNWSGIDAFSYVVADSIGNSDTGLVSVTVTPVNDAPVAPDNVATTAEDSTTTIAVLANDSDADGDALSIQSVTQGANGSVAIAGTNVTYAPTANWGGTDTFSYVVSDGNGGTATATVTVTVTPVNDAPTFVADPLAKPDATAGQAYASNISGDASDAEGDALTFSKIGGPSWLAVASDGTLSGSPMAADGGVNSFAVKVADPSGAFSQATLQITVNVLAPVLVLLTPTNDATYLTPANIALSAAVTTNGHVVTKVQFLRATNLLGEDATAPFAFTWTNAPIGTHALVARLVYDGGSTVDSATATVTVATSLPVPWLASDVGPVGVAGSATYSGTVYTVGGAGVLAGTSDSLFFVHQMISGGGEIRARLPAFLNTGTGARIGVMIRDTLQPNSRYSFMGVDGAGGFHHQRRTSTGGATSSTASGSGTAPNVWVRVVRSNNNLTCYKSSNGTLWTQVDSRNISMGSNCYMGFAVTSGGTNTLNTSQFDSVIASP